MFSRKAAQALVKGHKEAPVSPLILIKKIMEYEQFAKMRYLFFFFPLFWRAVLRRTVQEVLGIFKVDDIGT